MRIRTTERAKVSAALREAVRMGMPVEIARLILSDADTDIVERVKGVCRQARRIHQRECRHHG